MLCAAAGADDYEEEPPPRAQAIAFSWTGRDLVYDGPDGAAIWINSDALTVTVTREPGGVLALHFDFGRWPLYISLTAYQQPGGAVDLTGRVTLCESGAAVGPEDCESYPSWQKLFESDGWLATDLRTCFRALE